MRRLLSILDRIDGRGYGAYKDLRGRYEMPLATGDSDRVVFDLHVDHVQGDPFAAPSRIAIVVPPDEAGLPGHLLAPRSRRIATADAIGRRIAATIPAVCRGGGRGSGKSGRVSIDPAGQEILQRTRCVVSEDGEIEVRLEVGLPAAGRRVLAREAEAILAVELPDLVDRALLADAHDLAELARYADAAEDAAALRDALPELGLCAFVAEGAILPRRSGVDDRPLSDGIPFGPVPGSLAVSVELPHAGRVRGLGLPRGVTLIVGGGYHGKSTLLEAIARGVYDHVPGDGRELVVTAPRAMAVRAEDGRRIEKVGIDAFIDGLPSGADTRVFSTDRASGSTSQAAAIAEALEVGCDLLLIDEDTSASNFLVRDHRMQLLVRPDREPISPFVDRVGQLHGQLGVSTILVAGGSGDFFEPADRVIQMDGYRPVDVTDRVAEIVRDVPSRRRREADDGALTVRRRRPIAASIDPTPTRRRGRGGAPRDRVRARATRAIQLGDEEIDIALLSQIVDPSQTRTIGDALVLIHRRLADGRRDLRMVIDELERLLEEEGLAAIAERTFGNRAETRGVDVAAALNRLRSLQVEPIDA